MVRLHFYLLECPGILRLNAKRKCGYVKEGKRIEQGDAKERKEGNLDPVEAENIHLFTCLF